MSQQPMPSRPIVMVVPDGMGDRPYPALSGVMPGDPNGAIRPRTPLEAADTPNLDALARLGRCGLMYPLRPGLAPSSHQAHFALFGYEDRDFPGRGLLEALGEGLPPGPDEVVLRANLAAVAERDGVFWIEDRPDPRVGEAGLGGVDLDAELDGVRVRFVHTGALQGLLYLHALDGQPLSHFVSDADPLRAGVPVLEVQPLEEAPDPDAAARTAAVLNDWMRVAHARLGSSPLAVAPLASGDTVESDPAGLPSTVLPHLDFMLVKWAGALGHVTPFTQRTGLRGISLGSGPLYAGLAAAVGLDHLELGTDRTAERDVALRVEHTLRLLGEGYDFVHLHTKHPDMAGHRKDPARKAQVIAAIDRALGPLVALAESDDAVVVVAPDHQTPAAGPLYHGGGAVPLVIAGGVAGADQVAAYGETACAAGSLGVVRGRDVLPLALDAADRSAFQADRTTGHLALGVPRTDDLKPLRTTGSHAPRTRRRPARSQL